MAVSNSCSCKTEHALLYVEVLTAERAAIFNLHQIATVVAAWGGKRAQAHPLHPSWRGLGCLWSIQGMSTTMPHAMVDTPRGIDFIFPMNSLLQALPSDHRRPCEATWHTDALHSTFRLNLGTFFSHRHEHGVHRNCCICAPNKPVQGTRYNAAEQFSAQEVT